MREQSTIEPQNPIQAVTHPNPYPYYRKLLSEKPLYFDESLQLWVASGAATVQSVLSNALCRVRPVNEPVPQALLDTPMGQFFGHLIRMNDGHKHHEMKAAVSAALTAVDQEQLTSVCNRWTSALIASIPLNELAFHLPIFVLGELLGVADDQLNLLTEWVHALVEGLRATSTRAQLEGGNRASEHLLEAVQLSMTQGKSALLDTLADQAKHIHDHVSHAVLANAVGFLSQAYEATAGVISNTLIQLSEHREILLQVQSNPALLPDVIQETLRFDPSIHNTRRFVSQDGVVAGQPMKAGEVVLVVLAAANHDAAANPQPDQFVLHRQNRQIFTFGHGSHACPGEQLAVKITEAAIRQCLASKIDLKEYAASIRYCDLPNARIPILKE